MYKCISLWLIVLTIIMTFCVSHQKQIDNESVANNLLADDTRLNDTENIILGKEMFIDYLERILGAKIYCFFVWVVLIIIIIAGKDFGRKRIEAFVCNWDQIRFKNKMFIKQWERSDTQQQWMEKKWQKFVILFRKGKPRKEMVEKNKEEKNCDGKFEEKCC